MKALKKKTPKKVQAPFLRNGGQTLASVELTTLTSLQLELNGLKTRRVALKKELTFVEADLYRKSDEFAAKTKEIDAKYGLQPNDGKVIDFKTGNIIETRKKE